MSDGKNTSASDGQGAPYDPSKDREVYLRLKLHDRNSGTSYFERYDYINLRYRRNCKYITDFHFTRIFTSRCIQHDVFEYSTRKRVVDFINGKSSTILTYGLSDSGKTHTMYGNLHDPGIIPRAIRLLFSTVRCTSEPRYKVAGNDLILSLDDEERVMEQEFKRELLDSCEETTSDKILSRLLANCNPVYCNDEEYSSGTAMSVWISVVSVSTDDVRDELYPESGCLKLSFREDGSAYLPDAKFVHIATIGEAYQLLIRKSLLEAQITKKERTFIFTIKLLKYQKNNASQTSSVSTLTFCDLFGNNYHYQPTGKHEWMRFENDVDSIAKYIRCISESGKEGVWPFWESNLTRLLKRPLIAKEAITFLVHVEQNNVDKSLEIVETSSIMMRELPFTW